MRICKVRINKRVISASTSATPGTLIANAFIEFGLPPEEVEEIEEMQESNPIIEEPIVEEPIVEQPRVLSNPRVTDDKESPKKDLFLEHIRKNLSNIEF
jgi:hypothetical protein